jgi:cobalt-zinc-cadmium efflux system membrane fusion protein
VLTAQGPATGATAAAAAPVAVPDPRELRLDGAQAKAANIGTQTAGPGQIQAAARFEGEVRFNEDRTAHVVPRLAGVAEAVPATLGAVVRKGQLLAVIASTALSELRSEWLAAQRRRDAAQVTYEREHTLWQARISAEQDFLQAQTALQEADIALRNAQQKLVTVGAGDGVIAGAGLNRLAIRAPFDGAVVEKHLALGEAVKEIRASSRWPTWAPSAPNSRSRPRTSRWCAWARRGWYRPRHSTARSKASSPMSVQCSASRRARRARG